MYDCFRSFNLAFVSLFLLFVRALFHIGVVSTNSGGEPKLLGMIDDIYRSRLSSTSTDHRLQKESMVIEEGDTSQTTALSRILILFHRQLFSNCHKIFNRFGAVRE